MELPILGVLDRNFSARSDDYHKFALEKDGCRKCNIYNDYRQVCQSEGNALDPIYMIVGEAAGATEIEQVRPFCGQAGQLLREILKKHRDVLNRKSTLITNTLSCRPKNNKFPTGKEPRTCFDSWLKREIKLVKPKIIICLGNHALKFVRGEMGITKARGTWSYLDVYNAWSFATFHPSYVMRCERARKYDIKQRFEDDFTALVEESESRLQVKYT